MKQWFCEFVPSLAVDSVFLENGEWDLTGMPSEIISAYYACCEHPYETIIFNIQVSFEKFLFWLSV